MDRTDFRLLVGGEAMAVALEDRALSVGREFLPGFALDVLDGREPTPAYWGWLAKEWERMIDG
jgi:hypothetical protein